MKGTKLYQVYEQDLEELERTIPEIADALSPNLTPRLRVKLRGVQKILSNIRWNYGPPNSVTIVPVDGEEPEPQC